LTHPYLALFVLILAEQFGLPIPAVPFLLGAGALAAQGHLSLGLALALSLAATLTADVFWFSLGRVRGGGVLNLLCRISLEPDSCVRRMQGVFERHGVRALLWVKFVPGLSMVTAPLAGIIGMRWSRFLLYDGAGSFVWAGSYLGLGWWFSGELERLTAPLRRLGAGAATVVLGVLAAYVLWKYAQRQRFLRDLRVARISPEELHQKILAGEDVVIVDLRQSLDFGQDPRTPPGALRMTVEELASRHAEIPRDREIVLYCT
jgi:membrane protein DedA with SNARE-associated domain